VQEGHRKSDDRPESESLSGKESKIGDAKGQNRGKTRVGIVVATKLQKTLSSPLKRREASFIRYLSRARQYQVHDENTSAAWRQSRDYGNQTYFQ
jgi:hypothetical protein